MASCASQESESRFVFYPFLDNYITDMFIVFWDLEPNTPHAGSGSEVRMTVPFDRPGDDDTVRRFDALLLRQPELAEAIAFYRRTLPTQRVAGSAVVPFRFDPQAAQRKLDAGIPLLVDEDLPFDPQALVALFGMLCRIAEAADLANSDNVLHLPEDIIGGSGLGRAAAKIRQAAEQGGLDFRALVRAVAANTTTEVARITGQHGIDTELSTMLVQNTLKPTLRGVGRHLEQPGRSGRLGQGALSHLWE